MEAVNLCCRDKVSCNTASYIYRMYLRHYHARCFWGVLVRRFFSVLRKIFIYLGDPLCSVDVFGKLMLMPISHQLPVLVATHRYYDRFVGRFSGFIHEGGDQLIAVDVGANIGDSVLSMSLIPGDHVLAVEPVEKFFKCLEYNVRGFEGVTFVQGLCGVSDEESAILVEEKGGTAACHKGNDGQMLSSYSLNSLLGSEERFQGLNFLKIDTDGYDLDVILGAKDIIERDQPAVLFELFRVEQEGFLDKLRAVFDFFYQTGYKTAVLYDNFGHFLKTISLDSFSEMVEALSQHQTRGVRYFDVFLCRGEFFEKFLSQEYAFFEEKG